MFIPCVFYLYSQKAYHQRPPAGQMKLHWFIPDGLRADPDVFQIFRWAREGKLPNIQRMMEQGSYGYSIPVFPSHTPVNFASLLTGTNPLRHGVADGPIRQWGYPLNMISTSGFSSIAKSIDPLWTVLEGAGLVTTLLSIPGSTPPEINNGYVIKGRWGGWGVEFPAIIFHSAKDSELKQKIGWNDRVFGNEKKLTEFVSSQEPVNWEIPLPQSYSPPREVNLRNWDADIFALISDSSNDGQENYDTLTLSLDKKTLLFSLHEGDWSPWFNVNLNYQTGRQYQKDVPQKLELEQKLSGIQFLTPVRIKVIQLGAKDMFRIRVLYGGLNESLTFPQSLSEELNQAAGPMVDFVDNYPPQLIYFPEDRKTFLEEAEMSFDWHQKAALHMMRDVAQDVFIHSIYTPNQMLTSRWWMGFLDPRSVRYAQIGAPERTKIWNEVLDMYKRVDDMLGDALDAMVPGTYLVFSSDHGVAPLNQEVRLNNLFARQGWLKFHYDAATQMHVIDWRETKVIYLNMDHIYLNPKGLSGPYQPASGPEYEKLRAQVMAQLKALANDKGERPLAAAITRAEAETWGLPKNLVGDLVIANELGFNWVEDVSEDSLIFVNALKSGYKQSILPEKEPALWTPFIVVGPGVKKNHEISRPISHLEQYPTILELLHIQPPYAPDREALREILEDRK